MDAHFNADLGVLDPLRSFLKKVVSALLSPYPGSVRPFSSSIRTSVRSSAWIVSPSPSVGNVDVILFRVLLCESVSHPLIIQHETFTSTPLAGQNFK